MIAEHDQQSRQRTTIFSFGAFAFAAAAVWVVPLVTGAFAFALAGVAVLRRDRLARAALIAAAVGTVVGFLLHLLPESFLQ